jgi:hypothetical protein
MRSGERGAAVAVSEHLGRRVALLGLNMMVRRNAGARRNARVAESGLRQRPHAT